MKKFWKYYLLYSLIVFFVGGIGMAFSDEIGGKEQPEGLYQKALSLKEDGNYGDALTILKRLASEYPENGMYELSYIDTLLDQGFEMKDAGNKSWNRNLWELKAKIKAIYAKYSSNADYYLIYAKYSCLSEAKRDTHIHNAITKAFYYKPNYVAAYIVKGDIYFDLAKKADTEEKQDTTTMTGGTSNSTRHFHGMTAKASYESSLSISSLSNKKKAYIYYKMGELKSQVLKDIADAKNDWGRAVALAPDSKWGNLAKKRLEQ
jgi:tetratricopeptide (TPR) repeat protein